MHKGTKMLFLEANLWGEGVPLFRLLLELLKDSVIGVSDPLLFEEEVM